MRGHIHSEELVPDIPIGFPLTQQPRPQAPGRGHAATMDLFFSRKEMNWFSQAFPFSEPQMSVRLPCSPASSGPGMTPGARATQATPKASGWAGQSPFPGAEHRDTAGKPGQLASGLQPGHKNAGSGHHRAEGTAVPNKVIVTKNAHIPKTQAQAWASADFQSLRPGRGCGTEGGTVSPGRGGRCLLDQKCAVPIT